ncbi:hypothetical protein A6R68_09536 [Neotoma lepida]|uniref:SPATA31 domain-containing protein n=1 Tax=Neotoma lepida TaxID=56216 RepID=A0A1A6FZI3_NEOLE|nr:hypothetical protein A6R68_09536 [Neotoma lepida]
MGQAEVIHGTSCSSALGGESSQHPQSVSSQGTEIFQLWKNPCKDLTNCLGRALKDLYRSPEGSLGKLLEAISEAEVESCHMRHSRSDSQSVYPVGAGKKQLEGIMKNHSGSKWRHTDSKPSNSSLSFWDSGDNSIVKTAIVLGEPFQRDPEEKRHYLVTTLDLLRPLQLSRGQYDFSVHLTVSHGQSLAQSQVVGSWTGNPKPNLGLVKGVYESQGSEGVALGDIYHGVSVWEISMASQSPSSRDTRELKEAEEESCDWALTMEAREIANSQTNNEHLRDLDSLETSESPPLSRTISQYAEDSSLSTPHCLATAGVLQDCAPEVVLATDNPGLQGLPVQLLEFLATPPAK